MIKTWNHTENSRNNIAISPSYFCIFTIVLSLFRYFDFLPPYSWLFTSEVLCFYPNSYFAFHDCGFAFLLLARNRNKRTCTLHVSTETPAWFESRWKLLCYFSYWNYVLLSYWLLSVSKIIFNSYFFLKLSMWDRDISKHVSAKTLHMNIWNMTG